MAKVNDMTPDDVGCPRLIPMGNLNPGSVGNYASMQKAYQDSQKSSSMFRTSGSMFPGFQMGYSNPAFGSNWGTFSNITGHK